MLLSNFFEHVPCEDSTSHTSFGVSIDTETEDLLMVKFFAFENFALADIEWRQNFTQDVSAMLEKEFPDREHVFCFA